MKNNKSTKSKNKLLKSLLVPSMAILSLASVSTIATSCGGSKKNQTNYTVTGGSNSLSGKVGKSGDDTNTWSLKSDNGETITSGVSWNIEKKGNTDISCINIKNGRVSWTDKIQKNVYNFFVIAQYEGKQYKSTEITLNIVQQTYEVSGGSPTLTSAPFTAGQDEKKWILKSDGESVLSGVAWSLKSATNEPLPENALSINEDGYVYWTDAINEGEYSFYVVAKLNNEECQSANPILLTITSKNVLSGGTLAMTTHEGTSGSDSNRWKAYMNGKYVAAQQWSVVSQDQSTDLTNIIEIVKDENGYGWVKWTDKVEANTTYKFKVVAVCDENKIESPTIELWVRESIYGIYTEGTLSLYGQEEKEGKAEKPWVLQRDGEIVKSADIQWKLKTADTLALSGIDINGDGYIYWTNQVRAGKHKFTVIAVYNNKEIESNEIVTLTIGDKVNYSVRGGSTTLSGKAGTNGSDEKGKWILYIDNEEKTPSKWGLESTIEGEELPGTIKINNGIVSWSSEITNNVYKFKVVAYYDNELIKSDEITLTINPAKNAEVKGGSPELEIDEGDGEDKNGQWSLYIDGTLVTDVTYSLVGEELPESLTIDNKGLVHWKNIKVGSYKFRVAIKQNDDEDETYYSDKITYIVGSSEFYLHGGSTALSGYVSQRGGDGNEWNLYAYTYDISPKYDELTWSIDSSFMSADGVIAPAILDGIITIDNGHVIWSNFNKEGSYTFRINCFSKRYQKMATSKLITLEIKAIPSPKNKNDKMIGFEYNRISYFNEFSQLNTNIYLEKNTNDDKVEYVATKSVEASVWFGTNKTINYKPIFNLAESETYSNDGIKYSIVYEKKDKEDTYDTPFFINANGAGEWYHWNNDDFKELMYSAWAPIYNKAKIIVTFQCNNDVSLVIPINAWNSAIGTPATFKLPEQIYNDKAVVDFDTGSNSYECYLKATNVDDIKKLAKFNIIDTYDYGIYSEDEFKIADIEIGNNSNKKVLSNVNVVNVTRSFTPCYIEVDTGGEEKSKLATAYVSYSIFLEMEFKNIMPDESNWKHNLFSLLDVEGKTLNNIGKCNFIWYFFKNS